jgi:mono/diheme cytochrome c family protein
MRKPSHPLCGALSAAVLASACQLDSSEEPARPVIHYSLSAATRALGDDGEPAVPLDVQANLEGSLEMLFGSPAHPQFMLLDEWKEAGFDLNWPQYAQGDQGSGEFSEQDVADMQADNQRVFRTNLRHIEAGEYELVAVHSWAPDLVRDWEELLAGTAVELRNDEFKGKARALFVEYYPTLASSAELYRQHCLHCHGPEGGGDGPTAPFLDPRPRDYRHGTFKFTAVGKSVPRRADLFRILDEGVTATAMPSFRRFSKAQLHGLVDYVRLLAMRGMVERLLVATYAEEETLTSGDVIGTYRDVWARWERAGEKALSFDGEVPRPTPESIARGKQLFVDAQTANCFSCHGPEGRGDGVSAFAVDPATGEIAPTYKDDWGFEVIPRNLRNGVFRGGRRPIDLYRRIKNGIAGTPMPEAPSSLTSDDIWALVHYVGTLSERPRVAHPRAHTNDHADQGEHDGAPAKH